MLLEPGIVKVFRTRLFTLGGHLKFRCSQRLLVFVVLIIVVCCVSVAYFGTNDAKNGKPLAPNVIAVTLQLVGDVGSLNNTQESQLDSPSSTTELSRDKSWNEEYNKRLENLRDICEKYDVKRVFNKNVWRLYTNRIDGHVHHCTTKQCPVLVDENKLFYFCFIQKVGSTTMKEYFLTFANASDVSRPVTNISAFHLEANEILHRVSPMYYPEYVQRRFYKVLLVRHPFDRIVSAFVDKGQHPRSERLFFYDKYWDAIMKKYRGNTNVTEDSMPTFKEFVKYLLQTQPVYYDEHWSPYWSRCDPCWVPYDFVGKLETAGHDLPHLLKQVGVDPGNSRIWENKNNSTRNITKKYFQQLSTQEIIELYKTYFLDFKLFGYRVEEFLPDQNVASIDDSINLYELVY